MATPASPCPSCGAPLAANAYQCLACGHRTGFGRAMEFFSIRNLAGLALLLFMAYCAMRVQDAPLISQ